MARPFESVIRRSSLSILSEAAVKNWTVMPPWALPSVTSSTIRTNGKL